MWEQLLRQGEGGGERGGERGEGRGEGQKKASLNYLF